jgi:hypothetical protein
MDRYHDAGDHKSLICEFLKGRRTYFALPKKPESLNILDFLVVKAMSFIISKLSVSRDFSSSLNIAIGNIKIYQRERALRIS